MRRMHAFIADIRRFLGMSSILPAVIFMILPIAWAGTASAKSVLWTAVKGIFEVGIYPVYGTQGVAAETNLPGRRYSPATWRDASGNLWVFGGQGHAKEDSSGHCLNDLWKYDKTTGYWTWLGGPNVGNASGVYGTQGVADASNIPGARQGAASWTDASGGFWLWGGDGYDADGTLGDLSDLWKYDATTGYWTWLGGSKTANALGVYGTQGVADAANIPGGRQEAVSWKDASGNLWLFGGSGYGASGTAGSLNDLWKLDATTRQWTWIGGSTTSNQAGTYGPQGTASASNCPGARYGSTGWTDASGNRWLFGGNGDDASGTAGDLNDLWKYDATTGEWTWVSGSSGVNRVATYGTQGVADAANVPGAREGAVSWSDASGNLWLYGGFGYIGTSATGYLCDLWKYDATTGYWTWVNGPSSRNYSGVYGTRGVADAANYPGARRDAISWTDASGKLWLYGGNGYDGDKTFTYLNDLWNFDPATSCWTWMKGSSVRHDYGVYGTQGVTDAVGRPSSRYGVASWMDATDNFWIFGGEGYTGNKKMGYANDLWKCDGVTGNWTWVSGTKSQNQAGAYGTQGVAGTTNLPGGRYLSACWKDASGNAWFFGGYGSDGSGSIGELNDLWKFDPTTGYWTWVNGANTANQAGTYGTQGVADEANVPGARWGSTSWMDATGNLWLLGGCGYDRMGSYGELNDLWKFNPATGYWTWVNGANTRCQAGAYGTQRMAGVANVPGARCDSTSWMDASGNLWLFGGHGYDGTGNVGELNDLWKRDPTTGEWTWVNGASVANPSGIYGTLKQPTSLTAPGGRWGSASWVDAAGNTWLFGGDGLDASGNIGYLNDLWRLDASTNDWTWVGGSSSVNQAGSFGTLGSWSRSNVPGACCFMLVQKNGSNKLWLWGGYGYDCGATPAPQGGLWSGEIAIAPPIMAADAATTDTTPTWAWSSGGDGDGTYRYQLNATTNDAWTTTTATSWTPTTPLDDGTYVLYVQERDAQGDWSAATGRTVTVDTTAPGTPVVTCSSTVTGNRRLTWTWVSGGGGNGTFRYQLDATDAGGWTTTTATSYKPVVDLPFANHVLYVQERDDAGNWSASGSCAVTVDAAQGWRGYR